MTDDEIYALLVEANPVPDPHRAGDPTDQPLRLVTDRSTPMHVIERPDIHATHENRPRRTWIAAAAAAVIVLLGLGALLVVTRGDDPSGPVDQRPTTLAPPEGVEAPEAAAAAAAAGEFYRSIASGEIDAAVEMSNPNTNLVADRAMWEMNAYAVEQGIGEVIGDCRAVAGEPGFVLAACDITMSNPVWNALGLTDALAPIRYYTDGSVQWQPYLAPDGGPLDFADANRAVVEYLREFAPQSYDDACNPTTYETGAVVNASGLALTRACAEVWVPLVDDIARWIVATGFGT